MEVLNEMKLIFPGKSANESFSRAAVAAFIAQLDPTIDEIADIKTAVSEAVTNAVIHGYERKGGNVEIICRLFKTGAEILIKDFGKGIEDIEQARMPMFTTKPEMERSGMGFAIMENFMDELDIESAPGKGTLIRMYKKINVKGMHDKGDSR